MKNGGKSVMRTQLVEVGIVERVPIPTDVGALIVDTEVRDGG